MTKELFGVVCGQKHWKTGKPYGLSMLVYYLVSNYEI